MEDFEMEDFEQICCLCGNELEPWHEGSKGYGNNPEPLAKWPQRCCDDCNTTKVIPARLKAIQEHGTW